MRKLAYTNTTTGFCAKDFFEMNINLDADNS